MDDTTTIKIWSVLIGFTKVRKLKEEINLKEDYYGGIWEASGNEAEYDDSILYICKEKYIKFKFQIVQNVHTLIPKDQY